MDRIPNDAEQQVIHDYDFSVNLDMPVNNNLSYAVTSLSNESSMLHKLNKEVSDELCGKS